MHWEMVNMNVSLSNVFGGSKHKWEVNNREVIEHCGLASAGIVYGSGVQLSTAQGRYELPKPLYGLQTKCEH